MTQQLFGDLWQGENVPLKDLGGYVKQVEHPRARAIRARVLESIAHVAPLFPEYELAYPISLPVLPSLPFPAFRFGFLRRHRRSALRRWSIIDRSRRNIFRGSPVAYLLCVCFS